MAQKLSSGLEFGLAPSFLGGSLRYAHPGRQDRSVFGFAYAETGKSQGFALRKAQFAAQNFPKYLHPQ